MVAAKGIFADIKKEALGRTPEPLVIDDKVVVTFPTAVQLRAYMDTFSIENATEAERERERIILGDAYEYLRELFDPLPATAWGELMSRVYSHIFGRGAEDVEGKS